MRRIIAGGAGLGLVLALAIGSLALAGNEIAREARAATARYNSIVQASRAGYAPFPEGVPLHECIMAEDSSGGMGFHWLNPSLLDAEIDPSQPEVLVYAPRDDGSLDLVALEYVVFADAWAAAHGSATPTVLGQALTLVPDGNRYEIPAFWQRHIWLYEANEDGLFADFNPAVTC